MHATERDGKLIAHFAAQCSGLCESKMMRIRGLTTADQAGLRGHELQMDLVAVTAQFGDGERALVNAGAPARLINLVLFVTAGGMVRRFRRCPRWKRIRRIRSAVSAGAGG